MFKFSEMSCIIAVLYSFHFKVSNCEFHSHNGLSCNIPLHLARWILRESNIMPSCDEQEVWLWFPTSFIALQALLAACLEQQLNIAAGFTGHAVLLDDYVLPMAKGA